MRDAICYLMRVITAGLVTSAAFLSGCGPSKSWQLVDMDGRLPSLAFNMSRAGDGRSVNAEDFRGRIVVLEFGYTSCPDVCPTTLSNLTKVLRDLGEKAEEVRVLFVTVDPDRDTTRELKQYISNFAPQVVGLRGTHNQLATLARRYRVAYSVTPADNPADTKVMHTSTLFLFDRNGRSRLLAPDFNDISSIENDLRQLIGENRIAARAYLSQPEGRI